MPEDVGEACIGKKECKVKISAKGIYSKDGTTIAAAHQITLGNGPGKFKMLAKCKGPLKIAAQKLGALAASGIALATVILNLWNQK